MANPSLQIGNSNWAIKKDNLLGYSTAGTRFLPIPITMTRASAGTRVNPQGLVETVELLGSENIDLSSFVSATNWAINGSEIEASGTTALFKQPFTLGAGKTFKITIVVDSITSGNFEFWIGGYSEDTPTISVADTYTYYVTSGGSESYMGFNPHSNLIATISSVSVKESTRNDLARVDYTGSTSSLLAEPQRTNLLPYSSDFSEWAQVNIILTPNSVSSPSGDVNAYKITPTSTSGVHKVRENLSTVSGDYTLSIFAKQGEYKNILLWDDILSGGLGVNLDDLSIFRSQNNQGYNVENYGNGWIRISVTLSYSSQQISPTLYIYDNSATPQISFAGNDINGLYIWGAQVEQGSYATSYIPTSGSTVTRVQDQYSKTGISDKINSEEGVLFLESSSLSNDGTSRCISIFQNGSNFIKFIYSSSSNRVDFVAFSDGNVSCNIVKVISNTTENTKFALKWKVNDFALWIDGVEVGTDLSGNTPLGMDKISFTNEGGSSGNYFGKVKQLQVFKTALTDIELATLTT